MAQRGSGGGHSGARDYTAALLLELLADILRRVPETDRRVSSRCEMRGKLLFSKSTRCVLTLHPPPSLTCFPALCSLLPERFAVERVHCICGTIPLSYHISKVHRASCGIHLCRLRHVPLVSRRFREACRDPSLWPELRVRHGAFSTEARWWSFLLWMAVRGSGLQTLVFGAMEVWPVTVARDHVTFVHVACLWTCNSWLPASHSTR